MRRWRALHPELQRALSQERNRREIPERTVARRKLNKAIDAGDIDRPSECSVCGREGWIVGHHWHGYAAWADVQWLCPGCHKRIHNGEGGRDGTKEPGVS